jgi:hypothetical protein
MKLFTRILLFLFILFLSTPTLVTLIEKDTDTSIFYCFAEEEHQKEVKAEVKFYLEHNEIAFIELEKKTSFIEYNSEHQTVFREIFSPPPNCI